jgi:NADPH:quinone reductase-like Zn-dependent oxidoreductase
MGLAGGVCSALADAMELHLDSELQGAYAEYIVVPQPHVVQKPSHLSWVKVASIPECFLTRKNQQVSDRLLTAYSV